jgi:beta-N-acetylhexosaminidase
LPGPEAAAPLAAIFGCAGPELSADEAAFFRDAEPLGLILFARNCETPEQIRRLTGALRAAVGRAEAPVLIDQEGGRVQRLKPPNWREAPAAARFGDLARRDPAAAVEAAGLNGRLLALELAPLGIDVDCVPCLDVRDPGGHDVIGDRAFSDDPDSVAQLGRALAAGLLRGGVLPVIKHLPGHGRARVDSHHELPLVEASRQELSRLDFAPFAALADLPLGMTGHLVYTAVDGERPSTLSPVVIEQVIRRQIGFDGLLMTDDLSMRALGGDYEQRTRAALDAGCDLVLHCNGDWREMQAVAEAAGCLSRAGLERWARVATWRQAPDEVSAAALTERLDGLLAAP